MCSLILRSLIPLRLLCKNQLPTDDMLHKYDLYAIYQPLIVAYKRADIRAYNDHLGKFESILVKWDLYSYWVIITFYVYRNLFRKVYAIPSQTMFVPLLMSLIQVSDFRRQPQGPADIICRCSATVG